MRRSLETAQARTPRSRRLLSPSQPRCSTHLAVTLGNMSIAAVTRGNTSITGRNLVAVLTGGALFCRSASAATHISSKLAFSARQASADAGVSARFCDIAERPIVR